MSLSEAKLTDLLQILDVLYIELLKDAEGSGRGQTQSQRNWHERCHVDMFAEGVMHGSMGMAAGFVQRVIKRCGPSPWSIVAHTHECMEEKRDDKTHPHVCGFYAVWIAEGAPATVPVKITFPFTDRHDMTWRLELARDIHALFQRSGTAFAWDAPVARRAA